jgi:hypothetical protein
MAGNGHEGVLEGGRERPGGYGKAALPLMLALLVLFLAGCSGSLGKPQSQRVPVPGPTRASYTEMASIPFSKPMPPNLDDEQMFQALAALSHPAKAILVSLEHQVLYAYEQDTLVRWSYVTTGRPELQSPRGFYAVTRHLHPVTLYSKWPPGSPYYYPPVHANYALRFLGTDFLLHDYSERHYYGPGTNVWHQNPDGTWETGSHGCVEVPLDAMQWLYDWAPDGTPVVLF